MDVEGNMTSYDTSTEGITLYIFVPNVFTRMQDDANLRQQPHSPPQKKTYLPGKNVLIQI
jgi:hypothetical protein